MNTISKALLTVASVFVMCMMLAFVSLGSAVYILSALLVAIGGSLVWCVSVVLRGRGK